jgi:MYXO-CTERM domain-containing protein
VPSSGCGCAATQPTAAAGEWLLGAGLLVFARRGRRARPRAA